MSGGWDSRGARVDARQWRLEDGKRTDLDSALTAGRTRHP